MDSFPVYAAANPADSAAAVGYAILLSKYNTKSGAILDLFGRFARLPAATYGVESPSRFYLLLAGAFPTRVGADSLLTQLRVSKTLAQGFGLQQGDHALIGRAQIGLRLHLASLPGG